MKKSLALTTLSLALLLTACGGGSAPSSNPTQVPAATETSPSAEATVEAALEESPSLSSSPTESAIGNVPMSKYATSDRGLTVYEVGDAIDFYASDSQAISGTMTINKVRPSVKCDANEMIVDDPENGRFVGIDVSIVTPKASSEGSGDFSLNTSAFSAVAENGTTMNGDAWSFAAYTCMEENIKTSLGPGRKATGTLILDIPKGDSVVTYEDFYNGGGGWEIAVPGK
ncbi:DUF4352 domain-containing protein [Paeniglutamicibacter terrestris]|uniref:DUF4352 domain-containing protein n=1 Tax=Paeniglutamicibacter terrestris TaxID=2723403 RepID=A0ABX1G8Z3_9MICC|nr:DUF4352 domain-containing protein [Paeniglutamicibacter terrestris]NKG22186.1 DUF4352 domain-containing protein [Paeniglutamicibacter terrestris]